jgi:hypothetical protein
VRSFFVDRDGEPQPWIVALFVIVLIVAAASLLVWLMPNHVAHELTDAPDTFTDADAGVRCYYVERGTNLAISCVRLP